MITIDQEVEIDLFYKSGPINSHFLNDLLPYDIRKKNGAYLRSGLKEYLMLLTALSEAMKFLSIGDLKKFDALVGENACEIRAVFITILSSKNSIDPLEVLQKIYNASKKIRSLLEDKTISRLMSSGICLIDVFTKENLFLSLNFKEMFVFLAFLLTESKTTLSSDSFMDSIYIKEKCDHKKIKKFGDISSCFADNLIGKVRKYMSALSVQYVREISNQTGDRSIINMLSEKFTIFHENRLLCTPMFWTYKSLLSVAVSEGIPLIVHTKFLTKTEDYYNVIDEDFLVFKADLNTGKYFQITQNMKDFEYNQAAWVVQGIACLEQTNLFSKSLWKKRFLQHSIETIILAGAADHRQYPDAKQESLLFSLSDEELMNYRSFAKMNGFSMENPSTFFIQHVYPSKIKTVLPS